MHRRALATVAACFAARPALAQATPWPARPVRILSGYSVGTTTDLLARLLAQRLGDRLQIPVVVENREGAGGTIAATLVARSPADGCTLMLASVALTMAPRLFRTVSFRPAEDFEPIGMIGNVPNVLLVGAAVPVTSVAELIAAARQAPGRFRYASSGPGSGSWIGLKLLEARTGTVLEEVPYTSTAQATTDAISGQVELHCPSLAGGMPLLRDGRLRALGVTSGRRSPGAPDIPAIAETVPGYEASTWYGLVSPAGVPDTVSARLSSELLAMLAEPAVQAALRAAGVDVEPGGPAALRAIMADPVRSGTELMDRIAFRPQ